MVKTDDPGDTPRQAAPRMPRDDRCNVLVLLGFVLLPWLALLLLILWRWW